MEEIKLALTQCGPRECNHLGYFPSVLANLCLPAKRYAHNEYEHRVGPYRMTVWAPKEFGVPFGPYPRAILSVIATEVRLNVKRGLHDPRNITLGKSVAAALERITGRDHGSSEAKSMRSGGARSSRAIMGRQLLSLANCTINYSFPRKGEICGGNAGFVTGYRYRREVWRPELVGKPSTKSIEVALRLNEDYCTELIENSFEIDDRILGYFWNHCLEMDIYVWISFRAKRWLQQGPQTLKWADLIEQFAGGYVASSHRRFKVAFIQAVARVCDLCNSGNPGCIKYDLRGNSDNVDISIMRPIIAPREPVGRGRSQVAAKVYGSDTVYRHKRPDAGQESLPLEPVAMDGKRLLSEAELVSVVDLYPRQEGRQMALKEVQPAVDRLTKDGSRTRDQALSFLRECVTSYEVTTRSMERRFIPYPAKWLAEERYLDQEASNAGAVATAESSRRRRSAVERLQAQGAMMRGAA